MSNLGIWFLCFWEVICPNWWTLAMIVVAGLVFVLAKIIYGGKQVGNKGAMDQVGKRWQMIGYVIIAAAIVIYAVEMLTIHTMTVKIVADSQKPQINELQNLLRVAELDINRLQKTNIDKLKRYDKLARFVDQNYKYRSEIPLATARKLDLERKFSQHLANNADLKLPKLYNESSDRALKNLAEKFVLKNLGYSATAADDAAKYNNFKTASFNEFANPEYKDAINKLKKALKEKFADREFKLARYVSDNTTTWPAFKKIRSKGYSDHLLETWKNDEMEMLDEVFNQRASSNSSNKMTFGALLPDIKNELAAALRKTREKCFSQETQDDISKRAVEACEASPGFGNLSLEEKKARFFQETNRIMAEIWREEYMPNTNLTGQEYLLYGNDKSDLSNLLKKLPNIFNFNKHLSALLNAANFVLNFFWLLVIVIVVLFVFINRGKQIRSMGKVETIKSKIARG